MCEYADRATLRRSGRFASPRLWMKPAICVFILLLREEQIMNLVVRANTAGTSDSQSYGKQNGSVSVLGSSLNLLQDPIEEKRKQARQQAFGVISDAWDNDREIDASVASRREHYRQMLSDIKENRDQVKESDAQLAKLQELYGVSADSEEQQTLNELMSYHDKVRQNEPLTLEESKRMAEISENLTEYQQRAIEIYDEQGYYKDKIADSERKMQDDIADITAISIERLKSHPMVDAKKQADKIMEAANREIIGMLTSEAREHIDEKAQEEKEKAEKAEEKQEEQEDRLLEAELKRAVERARIEGTEEAVKKAKQKIAQSRAQGIDSDGLMEADTVSQGVGATSELSDIKNSMKLLEADLKGIQVDESI